MTPTLALHHHLSTSDRSIARVATARGWTVVQLPRGDASDWRPGEAMLRHYGNTSRRTFSRRSLPIAFHEIDVAVLASVPWATHRMVALMGIADLELPLAAPTFVKPVQGKWFRSRVYEAGEVVEPTPEQLSSRDPRDRLIYTAAPVRFGAEVRCWCLDGAVLTSSTYRGPDHSVDLSPIIPLVAALYTRCPTLPRAAVLDFGAQDDGTWSLIEINKPWASDLYRADPSRCFDCVVASQTQRLS